MGDTKIAALLGAVLTKGTKTIIVGTGGLAITSGELNVVGGSTLDIDGQTVTLNTNGKVSLAGGAAGTDNSTLKITSTGKLTVGDINIAAVGTLTASGA